MVEQCLPFKAFSSALSRRPKEVSTFPAMKNHSLTSFLLCRRTLQYALGAETVLLVALFALYARYNRRAQEAEELDADEVGTRNTQGTRNTHPLFLPPCRVENSKSFGVCPPAQLCAHYDRCAQSADEVNICFSTHKFGAAAWTYYNSTVCGVCPPSASQSSEHVDACTVSPLYSRMRPC